MTVTLADVAAHAGVSPATVSRVLSGNYPVAEATRARVLRAVDDLDYVVNGPASALASANSDLVGILVNDIAEPFFGIMAGAIQSEMGPAAPAAADAQAPGPAPGGPQGRTATGPTGPATAAEKLAFVCDTNGSPERELTSLTLLQRQRAAAVTGSAADGPEHAERLAAKVARLVAAGTRVVLCGRPPVACALALTFDNRGGARRLTEHLLTLGHRRVGYIAGPAERTTTRHRLEGHLAALAAHGLTAPDVGGLAGRGPRGGVRTAVAGHARGVRPGLRLRRGLRTPAPRTRHHRAGRGQRHGRARRLRRARTGTAVGRGRPAGGGAPPPGRAGQRLSWRLPRWHGRGGLPGRRGAPERTGFPPGTKAPGGPRS